MNIHWAFPFFLGTEYYYWVIIKYLQCVYTVLGLWEYTNNIKTVAFLCVDLGQGSVGLEFCHSHFPSCDWICESQETDSIDTDLTLIRNRKEHFCGSPIYFYLSYSLTVQEKGGREGEKKKENQITNPQQLRLWRILTSQWSYEAYTWNTFLFIFIHLFSVLFYPLFFFLISFTIIPLKEWILSQTTNICAIPFLITKLFQGLLQPIF